MTNTNKIQKNCLYNYKCWEDSFHHSFCTLVGNRMFGLSICLWREIMYPIQWRNNKSCRFRWINCKPSLEHVLDFVFGQLLAMEVLILRMNFTLKWETLSLSWLTDYENWRNPNLPRKILRKLLLLDLYDKYRAYAGEGAASMQNEEIFPKNKLSQQYSQTFK